MVGVARDERDAPSQPECKVRADSQRTASELELSSAERATDAQAWLRSRVSGDADLTAAVERLNLTAGGVRAIETARLVVEAATASRVQRAAQLAAEERELSVSVGLLRDAACLPASVPAHALARACAALELRDECADSAVRASAAATVAADVLRARDDAMKAHIALARAQDEVRGAADELQEARKSAEAVRNGAVTRAKDSAQDWDRVAVFDAKRAEYAEASAAAKRAVRASGVDTRYTHDAVAARARSAKELGDAVQRDEDAAAAYCGLPPVRC